MTTITAEARREESTALRAGVGLMTLGAVAFVGYAVIFFVRNFTDGFLELGIGAGQVDKDKDAIQAFSPDVYHTSAISISRSPASSPQRESRSPRSRGTASAAGTGGRGSPRS